MINEGKKVKILKRLLYLCIVLFAVLTISTTSIAYFTFKKVYEGDGNLPKLNLYYSVSGSTTDVLKNISYNGQTSDNVTVKLNTMENNVSGYVRAKVAIIWSNSLNNTPYDDNNELVTACEVVNSSAENASLWEYRNGYFYLKAPMEKDTEVTLFDTIRFAENISSYRGERVSLIIIAEIYQTTNLPENW